MTHPDLPATTPIDREALVRRHNVVLHEPNPEHVLTVGNGNFAYTADVSGMQTFAGYYDQLSAVMEGRTAINTATMSSWGWHEMPNPEGYVLEDAMSAHATRRGSVRYPDRHDLEGAMRGQISDENLPGAWLNANPQRLDLGRIGLLFRDADGAALPVSPADLSEIDQRLDLWTGTIETRYVYAGENMRVTTVASPDAATVAFRIESNLLTSGRLAVGLKFPYAHQGFFQTSDWTRPQRHSSTLTTTPGSATIHRVVDTTTYDVDLAFNGGEITSAQPHEFELSGTESSLELVVSFRHNQTQIEVTSFTEVSHNAADYWSAFWASGAAIDFGGTADPRAAELERRIVLSQYLTTVNSAGDMPPQETGLITNSWSGKSHLEMHFWHAAHFAAWGRPELLRRSLSWYNAILPQALSTAKHQGYPGGRWPKQVGPEGRESPDPIGSFLIWQQPHILYLLQLVFEASTATDRAALVDEFADVVTATAEFMAAFAEERDGTFHLLPPVMPAQEFYDVSVTEDPTYELAYWWWGLEIAQRWNEHQGKPRNSSWAAVQRGLAAPHVEDGHYTAIATEPYLRRDDHPALLAAYGVVPPTPIVDTDLMTATLLDVLENWDWASAWGWDFPVMAMTAARLGRPDIAIDALMKDEVKNRFTAVGHNPQIHSILPIYLPGNGSLLAAVSLLATTGEGHTPAFPEAWTVQAEGFIPWPTTQLGKVDD
ncbi:MULTISPECIES: hypothetical protein [unclassified Frondihabitans]|uniref:hypothetical protein n=1 Tax=unclassified Frondihabitans TaxID=2626248 RepID=UPI000F4D9311|nr:MULTISPECIES: hypothetical protein [unclassified Frondihabitans]RPE77806.1 hypothetical protein EDF37_0467 [Frondihabitans sp. PhB153]RPF08085.1 hypothetical protein EDF39_0468 [Frondihabitans sp. PhB161]